jgi:integrase
MGVFTRSDSKYLWVFLETAPPGVKPKQRTDFLIGHTAAERKANWASALAVYGDKMAAIGKGAHGLHVETAPTTFDTFADWYTTHVLSRQGAGALTGLCLARLRRDFGPLLLTDPSWRQTVVQWRTTRLTTPMPRQHQRKDSTASATYPLPSHDAVNKDVVLLQTMFKRAVQEQLLPASPLAGLKRLPTTTPLRRVLSDDDERRLLAELRPADRAIFVMALDTLVRIGNVLSLRHQDDHGTTLDIPKTKTGTPITVPCSRRLRRLLDAIPPHPDPTHRLAPYVFWHRRTATGGPRNWYNAFRRALIAACKRADVPYGKAVQGLTIHWGTRRTGASRALRKGGSNVLGQVQQLGGWKRLDVLVGIYQEVTRADLHALVETIAPAAGNPGNSSGMEMPKTGRNGDERRKVGRRASVLSLVAKEPACRDL